MRTGESHCIATKFRQESSDDDDDDVIGPLPPSQNVAECDKDAIAREFENR